MRILLSLLAVAAVAAPAPASAHPSGLQRHADAIHALGLPGAQARLVTESGRHHVATSGFGDLATGRPVPPDGRFRIASTGKSFVATVTLQLVGEGRLRLDDTVERWLPGVVRGNGNHGRRITVRHLLQHTSGIHDDFPDYTTEADFQRHRYDAYTPEQIVARAMAHEPDFKPGKGWRYSSTGYLLVDMIIERVTGNSWWTEVDRRIVRPLGLTATSWPGLSPEVPRPHARGYQVFETGRQVDVTEQVVVDPEAAITSTTRDLNTFFRALLGGRLLRPAQLAAMTRTVRVDPGLAELLPGARYGLGLFRRPLPCGGVYWGHPGGGAGYFTDAAVTTGGRRSVVLSVNGGLGDFSRQQHAADALVEGALCGTVGAGTTRPRRG
jgi:D-alanyl-D-alanine carboxypeptidase